MGGGGGEETIPPSTDGKTFTEKRSSFCTGPPGRKEAGGLRPGIEQNQGIVEREAKPDHGGERERNETPMMQTRRGREEQRP